MAPEKVDPESDPANTSTVSDGSTATAEAEHEQPDPYFEPVVTLPEISIKTNEEEELEMLKLRCKMFRYSTVDTPGEWKERGTGDVKILKHEDRSTVRLVMRQDKTLKIRANHYISPYMELKPNCGSDRAWVWSVPADFADEEPKQELFAIKFANADHANLFAAKFNEARGIVTRGETAESCAKARDEDQTETTTEDKEETTTADKEETTETVAGSPKKEAEAEEVTKEMEKMKVKDSGEE